MRVLVATKQTQGQRKNDFCWCDEGELITFGSECDGEAVDGKCGCKRAMIGILSGKATTTMMIVDRQNYTIDQFKAALKAYCGTSGWAAVFGGELDKHVSDTTQELLRLAAYFPDGAIIEKRGGAFQQRRTEPLPTLKAGMSAKVHFKNAQGAALDWQGTIVTIEKVMTANAIVKMQNNPTRRAKLPRTVLVPLS